MYTVFIRNWYKAVKVKDILSRSGYRTEYHPDPRARRTFYKTANTEEEARQACQDYNASHKPGPKSRKAEYTKTSNY